MRSVTGEFPAVDDVAVPSNGRKALWAVVGAARWVARQVRGHLVYLAIVAAVAFVFGGIVHARIFHSSDSRGDHLGNCSGSVDSVGARASGPSPRPR